MQAAHSNIAHSVTVKWYSTKVLWCCECVLGCCERAVSVLWVRGVCMVVKVHIK